MALSVRAQNVIVSPEVGYERASLHVNGSEHMDITTKTGNGLRIGASVAYEFKNNLLLRSGLSYSYRGGSHIYNLNNIPRLPYVKNVQLKTTEFLTIPLTIGYELSLSSKWGVGIEAGGYIATSIGMGNAFFDCTNGEGSAASVFKDSQFTIATPDGTDRNRVDVKGSDRIDTGLNFGVNVRFDRIKLRANYQLGMHKTIFDMGMPRIFTVSLAYDIKL